MSACELLEAYRSKQLSPVEVTKAMFQHIEIANPSINAVYFLVKKAAITAAEASEKRWLKGAEKGLLDGIPMTVKDALPTKGMPSFRGSAANVGTIATTDHSTVARIKEHHAIILGKNTMCDYGILGSGVSSKHGVTRNPWNIKYNTGASSSGAAASIAAGIGPIAIGTDIVGSIRLPASFCGLYGLKPSQGRVPYYFPNSPSLVAGPMARNVTDAALLMTVISQADKRDFTALPYQHIEWHKVLQPLDLSKKKALLVLDLGFGLRVDEEVKNKVEQAAKDLVNIGLNVEILANPPFTKDADAPAERFYKIRTLTEYSKLPAEDLVKSPIIYQWTRAGEEMSAKALYADFLALQKLREKTMQLMDGYDFLLLPSAVQPPFLAEKAAPDESRLFDPWGNTFLFNLTEQPAASINCGFTQLGLPIGLQIVGQRYDDIGVFRLSKMYEEINGVTEFSIKG
jgi:Asp-tRNA(Asn)/Glu-tRNA(Gln) amidotransferase A subunit family amidase